MLLLLYDFRFFLGVAVGLTFSVVPSTVSGACTDIGWDMANDMWSLGCILMELYTGDVLFRTHEHLEHLAMMVGGVARWHRFWGVCTAECV